MNIIYYVLDEKCKIGDLSGGLKPGELTEVPGVLFTGERYCPVLIIC